MGGRKMSGELVRLEVDDRGVATITLNNPQALNALSEAMGDRFVEIIDHLTSRDDIAAVVLTGAGKAFSAGGDLAFLEERAHRSTPEMNTRAMMQFYARFLSIRRLTVP